jgi:mono/diheme cytochrome c family protein
MTSSRLGAVGTAAILVAASGLAIVAVRASATPERRGLEYMPDMGRSLPYDSFAPNPVTRDGKTLLAPVAGTVPRGVTPFRYLATTDDALRAGRELRMPIARSAGTLERGRALYETFCFVCHGERGQGDGPLVPRIPNPPAYTSPRVRTMAPGQIFHVISRGSGRMPSYAAQIPYDERWLVVLYVMELRERGAVAR